MAGKLNLWNDGYITIFGISYHVSDLLLRIKTTMRIRIYIVPRLEVCTCPPGTHLRQSGIFLYLYTPAMIFSQMPVEHIQLVHGEVVDKFFDIFQDRKSTRLNSSHVKISYAVFCLKKKNYTPLNLQTQYS